MMTDEATDRGKPSEVIGHSGLSGAIPTIHRTDPNEALAALQGAAIHIARHERSYDGTTITPKGMQMLNDAAMALVEAELAACYWIGKTATATAIAASVGSRLAEIARLGGAT